MRRAVGLIALAALVTAGAACSAPLAREQGPTVTASLAGSRGANPRLVLYVEPGAGMAPLYRLVTGARHSVDLTMYELSDPTAEHDLAADASRGVDVRVILDAHLEKDRNQTAYRYLAAHQVHVTWGPAGTTYHQKTLTVDDRTSAIMTGNWVAVDYADTRDFTVVDTNGSDVAAIVRTFDADFAHRPITPPDGTDLVWSPSNSMVTLLGIIDGASHTLAVENEEMDAPQITAALQAAARRGVQVEVTMTADARWDRAFDDLTGAGVHVATRPDRPGVLYIHAKAVVADAGRPDQRAFVGSENFSDASLDYNRELGIATSEKVVVAQLASTLRSDYEHATIWRG